MRSVALALIASLAIGGSAYAGERAVPPTAKQCRAIAAYVAAHNDGAFIPLTKEQFRIVVACRKPISVPTHSSLEGPTLTVEHERAETMAAAEPHCQPLSDLKAALKDAKFTTLTAGQFHFMAGLYVGSPITPPGGLPPGNGAVLIEGGGNSFVVWTRGAKHGLQACTTPIVVDIEHHKAAYIPMPIPPELLAMLREIKSGKDEKVMGTGGYDPDEIHL